MIDELDHCRADHHCPSARVVLADLARAELRQAWELAQDLRSVLALHVEICRHRNEEG